MAKKKSTSQAVDTATSPSTMTTTEPCAVDKRVVCSGSEKAPEKASAPDTTFGEGTSSRKDRLVFIDYKSLPVFDPGSKEYVGKEDELEEEDDEIETDY